MKILIVAGKHATILDDLNWLTKRHMFTIANNQT